MSEQRSERGSRRSKTSKRTRKKAGSRTAKKKSATSSKSKAAAADNAAELAGADRIYAFADQINAERDRSAGDVEEERPEAWVSFRLASEIYALPVLDVQEILRVGLITRVPHAPSAVLGVTNRRGRVLPVVDLRRRLELEAGDLTATSRVVVVSHGGRLIGLLVDAVRQVESVLRSKVLPPPAEVGTSKRTALQGVLKQHDEMIVLLDLKSLLELQQVEQQETA